MAEYGPHIINIIVIKRRRCRSLNQLVAQGACVRHPTPPHSSTSVCIDQLSMHYKFNVYIIIWIILTHAHTYRTS